MRSKSATEWRLLVEGYLQSDQTQADWCKANEVNLETFYSCDSLHDQKPVFGGYCCR